MDEEGHTSVVLHVDLDCFYAAVEHVRLGIPKEQPLAVQQWEGLIAINYAARAAGIVRHERLSDALRKCPDLHLVHVETIGADNPGTAESVGPRGNAKVSLERYRQASAKVFTIFRRYAEICERASIDEAYLDVSDQVEEMLQKDIDWESELQRLVEPAEPDGGSKYVSAMSVEGGSLTTFNAYDRRLLAGAVIADQVRASVREELGYTCSVGIASNKLLAKIASAKNKPDRQTLIPPRSVPGLMQDLPLKKIKLLGGKLGEEMKNKWGCTTAGEAQHISQTALVACFGDRLGTYAWKAVRGLKAEKVQVKNLVKSMLAAKSFSATNDLSAIRQWLAVLAQELAIRMCRDFELNQRQPKLFQLYYRSGLFKNSADHSKSVSMPLAALHLLSSPSSSEENEREQRAQREQPVDGKGEEGKFNENSTKGWEASSGNMDVAATGRTRALGKVLEDTAFHVFESLEGAFPCTRLALAASAFQALPGQGAQSIQHFFSSTTSSPNAPHQSQIFARQSTAASALMVPSTSEKPAEKPRGILKYLNSMRTVSPTLRSNMESSNEHEAPSTSDALPSEQLNTQEDRGPHIVPDEGDASVDLAAVNIEEQHRILEGIYHSKQHQSGALPAKHAKKVHHRSSNKRLREQASASQPKQANIGAFFRVHEKS